MRGHRQPGDKRTMHEVDFTYGDMPGGGDVTGTVELWAKVVVTVCA